MSRNGISPTEGIDTLWKPPPSPSFPRRNGISPTEGIDTFIFRDKSSVADIRRNGISPLEGIDTCINKFIRKIIQRRNGISPLEGIRLF